MLSGSTEWSTVSLTNNRTGLLIYPFGSHINLVSAGGGVGTRTSWENSANRECGFRSSSSCVTMLPVTYSDVLDALPRVHAVLNPTPLYEWPGLSSLLGCQFYLKHENHQPTGAFKVRGGVNLVATLSEAEQQAGILGCSTGNHGQSLAFAARRLGVRCTIVILPLGNNQDKNLGHPESRGPGLIQTRPRFRRGARVPGNGPHLTLPRGGRYVPTRPTSRS